MITNLYNRYFQKSRSFLYPALGISRQTISPIQTFIELDDVISSSDYKLVCVFQNDGTKKFRDFESKVLFKHPLYEDSIVNHTGPSIYIFNLSDYKDDWDLFLLGKYSKLSEDFKFAIREYYGEKAAEYKYIDTYLYPNKYYSLYSKLLDIPIDILVNTVELCDIYNPEKEKLIFSPIKLENSNI